jgi:alpha/beta superfamily hydrolase
METPITFETEDLLLEGLLCRNPGERGVVITHPHSLYGGDMHNPVVEAICRVYQRKGFSTLRFNFRGVGGSQGRFGDGIGEQQDVLATISFLTESGLSSLHLAGYSFGSRVIAGIKNLPKEVLTQLYIAPPVAFMDYTGVSDIAHLQTVIVGADDDIAPPEHIRKLLSSWNPDANMIVLNGCDHFFSNSLDLLEQALKEALE